MQKNVIEYLDKTATLYPEKIAVRDSYGEITFSELRQVSYKVAGIFQGKDLVASPICVYIPKGCQMIEAFAGINRSGNFYVPLDTKSPESRILSIINVLESKAVITNRQNYEKLHKFCDVEIVVIEDVLESASSIENIIDRQIDTDPVYSIFTSGSTGTPKGVVVSHRGFID